MADRIAAAGGGLFVLCGLSAGPMLSKPPAPDASAVDVRAWFLHHHDGIVAASLLSVLGALGLMLLVAGLRRRGSTLVTLAGGLVVTMGVLGGLLQAATAQLALRTDDDRVVGAAYALERAVFFDAPAVTTLVLLAAAAAVLPRWLGGLGIAIGLLGLVAGMGDLARRGGFPAAFGLSGFLLTVLWVAAASVVLGRDGSTSTSCVPAPAPA